MSGETLPVVREPPAAQKKERRFLGGLRVRAREEVRSGGDLQGIGFVPPVRPGERLLEQFGAAAQM